MKDEHENPGRTPEEINETIPEEAPNKLYEETKKEMPAPGRNDQERITPPHPDAPPAGPDIEDKYVASPMM